MACDMKDNPNHNPNHNPKISIPFEDLLVKSVRVEEEALALKDEVMLISHPPLHAQYSDLTGALKPSR